MFSIKSLKELKDLSNKVSESVEDWKKTSELVGNPEVVKDIKAKLTEFEKKVLPFEKQLETFEKSEAFNEAKKLLKMIKDESEENVKLKACLSNIFKSNTKRKEKLLYLSLLCMLLNKKTVFKGKNISVTKNGIYTNHAYSVLGCHKDKETGYKYTILMNPHGGMSSIDYKKYKSEAKSKIKTLSKIEIKDAVGIKSKRIFAMELDHFYKKIDVINFN